MNKQHNLTPSGAYRDRTREFAKKRTEFVQDSNGTVADNPIAVGSSYIDRRLGELRGLVHTYESAQDENKYSFSLDSIDVSHITRAIVAKTAEVQKTIAALTELAITAADKRMVASIQIAKRAELSRIRAKFAQEDASASDWLRPSKEEHDLFIYIPQEQIEIGAISLAEAREREREIARIAKGVVEINYLFTDVAAMVADQGVGLDRIDANIEEAAAYAADGVQNLEQAQKYQKSSNSKCCIIILLAALAAIVFVIVVAIITN